jgi:hypothetical protein
MAELPHWSEENMTMYGELFQSHLVQFGYREKKSIALCPFDDFQNQDHGSMLSFLP